MPLVDPSTGEEYGTAPISNEQDIDNAYTAAAKALHLGMPVLDSADIMGPGLKQVSTTAMGAEVLKTLDRRAA